MKNLAAKFLFGVSVLFLSLLSLMTYAAAIMIIAPSTNSVTIRSDSATSVLYTVTNGTNKTLTNLTVDAAYNTLGNPAGVFQQNNNCNTAVLAPGASCTFNVYLNGTAQPTSFQVNPRVCAYNRAICSTTPSSAYLSVSVIPVTHAVYGYVDLISGSNTNQLQSFTGSGTLGTLLASSFLWANSVGDFVGADLSLDGNSLYIADDGNSALAIVSTTNGSAPTLKTKVGVGTAPRGVVLSPDGSRVYVANKLSNNVSVINTTTQSILSNITVGTAPLGVAVSPDGKTVYVANSLDNTVSVIDTQSMSVTTTIRTGSNCSFNQPAGVIVGPNGNSAYVSNRGGNSICVINTASNTVSSTIPLLGSAPLGLAHSLDGSYLYVAESGSGTVEVIGLLSNGGSSAANTISVGGTPVGVTLSPDNLSLFVSNSNSTNVTKINTSSFAMTTINVNGNQNVLGRFVG